MDVLLIIVGSNHFLTVLNLNNRDRIGQKHDVTVFKLVMDNTIEETIIETQRLKLDAAEQAFRANSLQILLRSGKEMVTFEEIVILQELRKTRHPTYVFCGKNFNECFMLKDQGETQVKHLKKQKRYPTISVLL